MSNLRQGIIFVVSGLAGIASAYWTFQGLHAYVIWLTLSNNPPFAAALTLGVIAAIVGLWVAMMVSGAPARYARVRNGFKEKSAQIDKGVQYLRTTPSGRSRRYSQH
jgi:hypothetical protein